MGRPARRHPRRLSSCCGPTWLFCHPQLGPFYRRQGFAPCLSLPPELNERLLRYQRHKALVALVREEGVEF
ncbi:hypothetical protein ACSX1C_09085 [Pseudomonas sp. MBLB4123]|uniref:hypothetical protein n=1 Tax=Pseudomonas sp. MBLB4123 TaxID=3451557 RepID=UPI003F757031